MRATSDAPALDVDTGGLGGAIERGASAPILLLSACPRCGSNFLQALITLHPHCLPSRVPEDFFLANSALLLGYCRSVVESWEDPVEAASELPAHLGAGLLRFAATAAAQPDQPAAGRLLLRSPTSEGIEAAATLFPSARMLVLVRDGPATVESGHRSFGWWYDDAMLAWRKSIRRILRFLTISEGQRCRLVRYEDLARDPAREMLNILRFLDLDETLYPFDRLAEVPVRGSSSFGRKKGEPVHWRPVAREPSFEPLARAQAWPSYRLKRFTWLAGKEFARLGYAVQPLSPFDRAGNMLLDLWHALRRGVVRVALLRCARPRLFNDRRRRYLSWRQVRTVT